MKRKKEYEESPLFGCLSVIVIIVLLLLAFGCNTQKHINNRQVNTDSASLQEALTMIEQLTKENEHYQQRVHELENLEVTFTEPPPCPQLNTDSLRVALMSSGCKQATVDSAIAAFIDVSKKYKAAQATIKKMADGSLQIKGNIASLSQSNQKLMETIRDREKTINFITEEYNRVQTELQKSQSEKVKEVKRSILSGAGFWIIFFIVGFGLGFYVCLKLGKHAGDNNGGVFG